MENNIYKKYQFKNGNNDLQLSSTGLRDCDRMVVGFITTYAISSYHHKGCCEFESRSLWGVLDTTLCDKVCQWLVTGRWLSPGTLVSFNNKTDHHDIAKILLKVVVSTITLTLLIFCSKNWLTLFFTCRFPIGTKMCFDTVIPYVYWARGEIKEQVNFRCDDDDEVRFVLDQHA
jgi:hypothetical protein